MNEEHVKRFKELMATVNRDGMDKLMAFVEKSDFFTAPASTRFHGSYEGGLLEHSLNVYDCLKHKKESPGTIWYEVLKDVPDESIIISALLHDICKTYFYTIEMRNKKIDGVWTQVPTYTIEDKIPLGHGEKSCFMIEEFIRLKPAERYAIRWHMGAWDCAPGMLSSLGQAMDKHPLVLALQEADLEASHILEVAKEK